MRAACCAMLAVLLTVRTAAAQRTDSFGTSGAASPYEAASLDGALRKLHATVDPAPEGKIVEGIDIVPLEVIEDRDPAPSFLNALHATTRESVIRREVLLQVGAPFQQYHLDETVRNLQSFAQLSLVLGAVTKGSAPDRVRVLVVTKDTWSLRSQFEIQYGSGGLDLLRVEPTERNVAGTLNSVLARMELLPESLTLGAAVYVPRLAGERLYLVTDANIVLARADGSPEGTYGEVSISRPQLSVDTPWVWGVDTRWADTVSRRYVDAKLARFDAPSTPEVEAVPDAFRARSIVETAGVVRSFGAAHKLDLSAGLELNVKSYVGLDPNLYDARVVRDFAEARVPTSDARFGPYLQARAYEPRFVRVHDLQLLGLQEDLRVGYDAFARVYPITRALGGTRDFVGADLFARYVLPLGDGYAHVTGESLLEVGARDVPTEYFTIGAGVASPRFFLGRVIVESIAIARPHNYLNERSGIGGEGRLRGYPSFAFFGENLVAYNAELRTRPVEILACQVGAAAFFDVGDAFDGKDLALKSSVGAGLRAVFPQLDRRVWRLDVAAPLVRSGDAGPIGFYLSFEQAFPTSIVTAPGSGPAQSVLNLTGGALGQ